MDKVIVHKRHDNVCIICRRPVYGMYLKLTWEVDFSSFHSIGHAHKHCINELLESSRIAKSADNNELEED